MEDIQHYIDKIKEDEGFISVAKKPTKKVPAKGHHLFLIGNTINADPIPKVVKPTTTLSKITPSLKLPHPQFPFP